MIAVYLLCLLYILIQFHTTLRNSCRIPYCGDNGKPTHSKLDLENNDAKSGLSRCSGRHVAVTAIRGGCFVCILLISCFQCTAVAMPWKIVFLLEEGQDVQLNLQHIPIEKNDKLYRKYVTNLSPCDTIASCWFQINSTISLLIKSTDDCLLHFALVAWQETIISGLLLSSSDLLFIVLDKRAWYCSCKPYCGDNRKLPLSKLELGYNDIT